ncbi:MAG: LysM peptidoglycan-binding domain-containing protein [Anaerolineae bacterium]|nr:LysM peptidoglycan-binding domain-containing protein [Anaerolineae bacterium]
MKRILRLVVLILLLSCMLITPVFAESWILLGNHTVRTGESLYCIGRAYSVDPWSIATQNGIVNVNLIHIGDLLGIPNVPASVPPGPVCEAQFVTPMMQQMSAANCTCRQNHFVVTGDTLSHLAVNYNVDMQAIATCNQIVNLDLIYIGDTLCIP